MAVKFDRLGIKDVNRYLVRAQKKSRLEQSVIRAAKRWYLEEKKLTGVDRRQERLMDLSRAISSFIKFKKES